MPGTRPSNITGSWGKSPKGPVPGSMNPPPSPPPPELLELPLAAPPAPLDVPLVLAESVVDEHEALDNATATETALMRPNVNRLPRKFRYAMADSSSG